MNPSKEVDSNLALARSLVSGQQFANAAKILQKIQHSRPKDVTVLCLLGTCMFELGREKQGIDFLKKAVLLAPQDATCHVALGRMQILQRHTQQGLRTLTHALELDSSLASAHANLGVGYIDAGNSVRAEASFRHALRLMPGEETSLDGLATLHQSRGEHTEAIECLCQAMASRPDSPVLLSHLGSILVEQGRVQEGLAHIERALQIAPRAAGAVANLALAQEKNGDTVLAEQTYRRALKLDPHHPAALTRLARLLAGRGEYHRAAPIADRATKAAPHDISAWCAKASVSRQQGKPDEAAEAIRRALEIDPNSSAALQESSRLDMEEGRVAGTTGTLEQTLTAGSVNLSLVYQLVTARKVQPGDMALTALRHFESRADSLPVEARVAIHYGLGKAYDDLGDYERAFPHFLEGAKLKRATFEYKPAEEDERVDATCLDFNEPLFERLRGHGVRSDVPIFVLGMPRSGTTLTEQIIASHPDVHGAGELSLLSEVSRLKIRQGAWVQFPWNISRLTPDTMRQWGSDYVTRLRHLAPSTRHITDKMPHNYLYLGLIPLMLPNARIIHVRRNPVDTCLSCFMQWFSEDAQKPTYDLAELGHHYANYARLMAHWRKVLPAGSFLEMQYEDLVANMEEQARRLIEYCGLDWHEACLSFHKTARTVKTASIAQVRQPIYNTSVERWRKYEKFLGPLLDALDEHGMPPNTHPPHPDDYALFSAHAK